MADVDYINCYGEAGMHSVCAELKVGKNSLSQSGSAKLQSLCVLFFLYR